MEENEILDLYQLQYVDLMALLSDQNPPSNDEIQRLNSISTSIMQNLGRNGPGLLSITGAPEARTSQTPLLLLARKLALLHNDDRKIILKDHNLGSDVSLKNLDRIVSSFAMQMKYEEEFKFKFEGSVVKSGEFEDLGFAFRELGFCMMELGLFLARVCDKQIGGCELEQSLLQSGTAKGRLIHYHSVSDSAVIKEAAIGKRHGRASSVNTRETFKYGDDVDDGNSKLWQQWHYDYGIFTILTSPMFMLSNGSDEQECDSPSGHTYLQVFHPEKKRVLMVRAPRGSFIVQVGESADVLSRGRLRATLHSVARPAKMENLSRETFVVFLQPAWSKTFSLTNYPEELLRLGGQGSESCDEEKCDATHQLNGKIHEIVPPLSSRLRDGMTFAEFSKETTKQYYSGSGLQPNR